MNDIFTAFSDLIRIRMDQRVATAEDSVRYTFFHAVCTTRGLPPHKIILEGDHSTDQKAHIDAVLELPPEGTVAVEFKYHRKLTSGSPRPRPDQAGRLVSDLARLARYSPADHKMLVYLTDDEMATYLRNPENRMDIFFDEENAPFALTPKHFANRSATFRKAAGKSIHGTTRCIWKSGFPSGHELRIWEVT